VEQLFAARNTCGGSDIAPLLKSHAYLLRTVYAAIARPGTTTFPEDLASGEGSL
jgi:hypothetical protein